MAPQLTPAQREQIVALREAGYRIKDIERQTGITRKTIRLWILRNEERGGDLSPYHRQVYARATTAEEDAAIRAAHQMEPSLNTQSTASQYHISTQTVRRRLKEAGPRHHRPTQKTSLTDVHAQLRISTQTVRRRLKEAGPRHHRPTQKTSLTDVHAQLRISQSTVASTSTSRSITEDDTPMMQATHTRSVLGEIRTSGVASHIHCGDFVTMASDTVIKVEPDTDTCGEKALAETMEEWSCARDVAQDDRETLGASDLINKVELETGLCEPHDDVKKEIYNQDTVEAIGSTVCELYADHEVKEELVIGPTVLQRPAPAVPLQQRSSVIKVEPYADTCAEEALADTTEEWSCARYVAQDDRKTLGATDLINKVKLETGLCEPHDDAKKEIYDQDTVEAKGSAVCELHADHEVKEKLVFTPIVLQRSAREVPIQQRSSGVGEQGALLFVTKANDRSGDEVCCNVKSATHTCRVLDELQATVTRTGHSVGDEHFAKYGHLKVNVSSRKEPKEFKCHEYKKELFHERNIKRHMRTHTEERPYKCNICDVRFTRKDKLEAHTRIHAGEKPYKCDMCSKHFTKKTNLSLHIRTHTGERPYKCDICSKQFTSKTSLNLHMRTHTVERPYMCNICNGRFTQKDHLQSHTRKHTGEKPYKCDVCINQFTTKSHLNLHIRTHTGEWPYKCDVCSNQLTTKSKLNLHMRTRTGEKPYKCNICDSRFTRSNNLETHTRIHTGEKPYKCYVCSNQFTTKTKLNLHMRTHTGERPYKCDVCSNQFTTKSKLNVHMRTHTGEKPYKCNICDSRFTRSNNLEAHTRIHTGERPYKCKVCDRRFTRKDNLESHTRIHAGEKPYKCDVCSKQLTTKANLNAHMRTHTGER